MLGVKRRRAALGSVRRLYPVAVDDSMQYSSTLNYVGLAIN